MMIWERRRSNTRSIWNLCLSTGIVGTMSPLSDEGSARLVPVAGPTISPLELIAKAGGLLMGRQEQCDLRLKGDAVSRAHARFVYESGRWSIIDLKSRWGTFVNGVRLTPDRETPLGEGDLVRINPWTFRFASVLARSDSRIFDSQDDSHQPETVVQTITPDRLPNLNEELLALLLESASGIHASPDEKALGELLLEKACQGSGMPNAALLRPLNDAGRYEVIAARGPLGEELNFSRSLLSAASSGNIAELSGSSPGNISESIISLGVRSALCVPILLGQTPAAFLYLDARGRASGRLQPLRPKASAFCMALARMGGLALSNLKRIEMERRSAQLEADLKAAATAQQWILPQRQGMIGPFRYSGQSRPGRHVGGDFYDVIPLSDDRMAIAIGDVSGKGIAASVLMTAAQGFLHAALEEIAEPRQAVIRLNHFIHERSESSKFVTLWVGVLNLREKTLNYVDAGHGYALLGPSPAAMQRLPIGEQLPVGVEADFDYAAQTVALPESGCALLISDGIVEQPASPQAVDMSPYGMAGVERTLRELPSDADLIADLFSSVIHHAGQQALADDATAVLTSW